MTAVPTASKAVRAEPIRRGGLPLDSDETARFLPWLVGVMVFLAALALAAMLAVGSAAGHWTAALRGSATIQVPVPGGGDAAAMDARVAAALGVVRDSPGVIDARPVPPAEAAALVEPWLGDAAKLADLPMPRLIALTVDPGRLDAAGLRSRLAGAVPGASYDDQRRWLDGLTELADSVVRVCLAVLVVVGAVAALSVVFATRSGLAVHREAIEVLHLIGARDGYIANAFAWQALGAALRGGVVGLIAAALCLWMVGRAGRSLAPGLLPTMALGTSHWILLVLLPALAALLAAGTARLAVLVELRRLP